MSTIVRRPCNNFCRGDCGVQRDAEVTIRGVTYVTELPGCYGECLGFDERSPIKAMIELASQASGYVIWDWERACTIWNAYAVQFPMRSFPDQRVEPCAHIRYKLFYLARDMLRAARPFQRCAVCRVRLMSNSCMLWQGKWYCRSRTCLDLYSIYQQEKAEWRKLRRCESQLKAMRKYLKTGNLEVLRSLPEGYGPARTSRG